VRCRSRWSHGPWGCEGVDAGAGQLLPESRLPAPAREVRLTARAVAHGVRPICRYTARVQACELGTATVLASGAHRRRARPDAARGSGAPRVDDRRGARRSGWERGMADASLTRLRGDREHPRDAAAAGGSDVPGHPGAARRHDRVDANPPDRGIPGRVATRRRADRGSGRRRLEPRSRRRERRGRARGPDEHPLGHRAGPESDTGERGRQPVRQSGTRGASRGAERPDSGGHPAGEGATLGDRPGEHRGRGRGDGAAGSARGSPRPPPSRTRPSAPPHGW
jgi:hypothetical protein